MADRTDIVRQIVALVEDLGRVVDAEHEASNAEALGKIDELSRELEQVHIQHEEVLAARQGLERELEVAEKRIETLVQKLKEARQAAAEAGEEARKALRRQLEALQEECDDARAELDQERSVRKRLEKGAAADDKRLNELEKALAAGKPVAGSEGDAGGKELAAAQAALAEARESAREERLARESVEEELADAHKLIEAMEKALKQAQEAPRGATGGSSDAEVKRLAEKLKIAEARLEQEQLESNRHAKASAAAEQRIAGLEGLLREREKSGPRELVGGGGTAARKPAPDTLLPHDLRPEPKPGAIFRPDWELTSLPCKSADQVLQAWGSVFNVQLSLEGYPSQYCTAFLVILKVGKQKQLFIVFNLKTSKHVLVCVPGKPPTDEAALTKALEAGRKYLLMSGFELEKVAPADMDRVLGGYFLKA